MSPSLRVLAAAKINWTLEVPDKRPDGYHEVRTILQTIDLCDTVTLRVADQLSLALTGDAAALASEPVERNLAYRAAALLAERTGHRGGAQVEIEKHIPIAAGLGGGSSDAAATLRGLRELWALSISDDELAAIAAELGSDVPFFLRGGTALASGRGEQLEPLPTAPPQRLLIAWPERPAAPDKTTRMYAALGPEQYSDGSRTAALAERFRAGQPVQDDDIHNAFEAALAGVDSEAVGAFQSIAALGFGQPHLCGAGPAVFFLEPPDQNSLAEALSKLGYRFAMTATTSSNNSFD